ILSIGGAKLNSVEYKEIANTLNILQENFDNFKKELLEEYDLLENLFKEICKGTSHFNSFLNKLNSCAKKVFIFEEI
ncbi:hypothetical protein, partial [Clostridium tarantellae]|uniref:hypothetical protein n=1 Tax=Clostridium tarantellae TaxID=39493 RepID=UPI0014792330